MNKFTMIWFLVAVSMLTLLNMDLDWLRTAVHIHLVVSTIVMVCTNIEFLVDTAKEFMNVEDDD